MIARAALQSSARMCLLPARERAAIDAPQEKIEQPLSGGRVIEHVAHQRGLRGFVDEISQTRRRRVQALEKERVYRGIARWKLARDANPSPGSSRWRAIVAPVRSDAAWPDARSCDFRPCERQSTSRPRLPDGAGSARMVLGPSERLTPRPAALTCITFRAKSHAG